MLKKCIVCIVFLVVLALVSTAQANYFANGDAEIGGDATTPPDGWTPYFVNSSDGNVGVSSDTGDGSLQSTQLTGGETPGYDYWTQCFIYTDVSVWDGMELTLSFDYKGDIYCGLSNQAYAGLAGFLWERVTEWTHWEGTFTAPAGTEYMWFAMYDNSGGPGNTLNSAWFDNISLIPEPATMTLIGLGGLALIRRRRK